MTNLPIITLNDPLLRTRSVPIERVDDELRRLADDMLETMYEAPGVGIAAVPVTVPRRLIVVDVSDDEGPRAPICLITPKIVALSDDMRIHAEGFL